MGHAHHAGGARRLADRVGGYELAVERLAGRLAGLRRTVTRELRTRTLVVGRGSFERAVIAGRGSHGLVALHARPGTRGPTSVELVAHDAGWGLPPHASVTLTGQGDVVGELELIHGHPAALHGVAPAG